jgi:hydrogenase nickel incorporation protein HypA/HybF
VHEMSIARSILDIAIEAAEKGGAKRITRVNVLAGELRAIEPLHLAFCFSIMAEDTIASAAELNVETVPVKGTCRSCGETFIVEDYQYACPKCHSLDIQTEGGTELRLTDIEVD